MCCRTVALLLNSISFFVWTYTKHVPYVRNSPVTHTRANQNGDHVLQDSYVYPLHVSSQVKKVSLCPVQIGSTILSSWFSFDNVVCLRLYRIAMESLSLSRSLFVSLSLSIYIHIHIQGYGIIHGIIHIQGHGIYIHIFNCKILYIYIYT